MVTKASRIDIREIARSLDCVTEAELQALGGITPLTAEAWRKRGTGPEYVRFGNTFLYPRQKLAEFLRDKVRGRVTISPGGVL